MGEDAIAELVKQGGLAVGLAGVLLIAGWIIKLLKGALDRQEERNDRMRDDLEKVADSLEQVGKGMDSLNGKMEGLALRLDLLREPGRRRSGT